MPEAASLLTPPRDWCGPLELDVVILINSRVENDKRRQVIRETWISVLGALPQKLKMAYVFLLGRSDNEELNKQVTEEAEMHTDMVGGHRGGGGSAY